MTSRILFQIIAIAGIVLFIENDLKSQYNNSELPSSIRSDGSAPDSSAMLDVQSTSQGILIPRMDSMQRKAINKPAKGLLVFDNDTNGFWFFNGLIWEDLSSPTISVLSDKDGDTRIDLEGSGDNDLISFELDSENIFSIKKSLNQHAVLFQPSLNSTSTFFGFNSGTSIDTIGNFSGQFNSFFGAGTGKLNSTGRANTFIGWSSGGLNTIGINNTMVGSNSGAFNKDGSDNVFLGNWSGLKNEIGSKNTFIGASAGFNSDSTSNLTFVGYQAGYNNTDGDKNTFVGYLSGFQNSSGSGNTFLGNSAGENNSDGSGNVFLGLASGRFNETGTSNTFVGASSGAANGRGLGNTFVGQASGQIISGNSAHQNTFIGYRSGGFNIFGAYNSYLGSNAGIDSSTASFNVAIGFEAGKSTMLADSNVIIGNQAGKNASGSNKLYIENSDSNSPLIYGEFDNDKVEINGSLKVTDLFNLKATGLVPSSPSEGDIYMDDGTNRADTNLGLRYFNGSIWVDL